MTSRTLRVWFSSIFIRLDRACLQRAGLGECLTENRFIGCPTVAQPADESFYKRKGTGSVGRSDRGRVYTLHRMTRVFCPLVAQKSGWLDRRGLISRRPVSRAQPRYREAVNLPLTTQCNV